MCYARNPNPQQTFKFVIFFVFVSSKIRKNPKNRLKIRCFRMFHKNFTDVNVISWMLVEHSGSFLEAHSMIPGRFREHSKFHENLDFSESYPDTSLSRKFAQTIESTQRMHRWISFGLMKVEKLIRSETNTQILRNLHCFDQNLVRAVNRQPLFTARGDS